MQTICQDRPWITEKMVARSADRWKTRSTQGGPWTAGSQSPGFWPSLHTSRLHYDYSQMWTKTLRKPPKMGWFSLESCGRQHHSPLIAQEPRKCSALSYPREGIRNQKQVICFPPLPSDSFLPCDLLSIFQLNQVEKWWKPLREATLPLLLFWEFSWVTFF